MVSILLELRSIFVRDGSCVRTLGTVPNWLPERRTSDRFCRAENVSGRVERALLLRSKPVTGV